ncbi:MAG: Uncharacterised protein [Bacteroidetes bacterium MED-G17]|nr:MAG: Uncharacterised protein [Bacteroidetes bacterium MED-G17]
MKNIFYMLLAFVLLFTACKDDDGAASPEPNDPLSVGEVLEDNTAMFSVFGATYCWNCHEPSGTYQQTVMDQAGSEMIGFKMCGDYSYASIGVTDEATDMWGNAQAEFGGPSGLAGYTLNNRDWAYLANEEGQIVFSDVANAAKEFGKSSDVKANVASKFSLDGKKFKLKYKFKAFQDLTSTHRVAFYIIANDMEAYYWPGQSGAELILDTWKPFLLGSLNGTFGEDEISDLKAGETFEGEVEFDAKYLDFDKAPRVGDLNPEITEDLISRADVVAVIWNNKNFTSYSFVNCSKAEKVQ